MSAGDLLIKKCLYIHYINDVDEFNVFVPKLKNNNEKKKMKKISRK